MKRLTMMGLGLLAAVMLGGCSVSRMNETAEKLDASREALRACLAAHQSVPDACAAEKEMFEVDRETYEARASAINGARRPVSSQVYPVYHTTPAPSLPQLPNMMPQNYTVLHPGELPDHITVMPGLNGGGTILTQP